MPPPTGQFKESLRLYLRLLDYLRGHKGRSLLSLLYMILAASAVALLLDPLMNLGLTDCEL